MTSGTYLLLVGVVVVVAIIVRIAQMRKSKKSQAPLILKENTTTLFEEAQELLDQAKSGNVVAVKKIESNLRNTDWKFFGVVVNLRQEAEVLIGVANQGDDGTIAFIRKCIRNPKWPYCGMIEETTTDPDNPHFELVDKDDKEILVIKEPGSLWRTSGPMPLTGDHPGRSSREPMGDHMS